MTKEKLVPLTFCLAALLSLLAGLINRTKLATFAPIAMMFLILGIATWKKRQGKQ